MAWNVQWLLKEATARMPCANILRNYLFLIYRTSTTRQAKNNSTYLIFIFFYFFAGRVPVSLTDCVQQLILLFRTLCITFGQPHTENAVSHEAILQISGFCQRICKICVLLILRLINIHLCFRDNNLFTKKYFVNSWSVFPLCPLLA